MKAVKGFIIAGTHSGCGKTSVTLGLMKGLARKGFKVAPFKTGPDFIDPGHHSRAAGGSCNNLDGWMIDNSTLQSIFNRHAQESDVCVVEGVMGLYDGFSPVDEDGSTAQLSKILNLPVVLVVDAKSMARSAAALVKGFYDFDPDTAIAGVIFNRVGSPRHEKILREALEPLDIPVLACLPKRDTIATPSRHLGLVTPEYLDNLEELYNGLADWVEESIDLENLLKSMPDIPINPVFDEVPMLPKTRIGIAKDLAFSFYYEENLRILRSFGAELVPFSPVHDKELPENLSGLYIGGGYPELSSFDLAQNTKLRRAIADFSASGKPVYAECGGFMYLMESISKDDCVFPMCGIFPFQSEMKKRFQALGYKQIELKEDCILGGKGTQIRGHEFHYSALIDAEDFSGRNYKVSGRKNEDFEEGFMINNTIGSYIHLHFGSNPQAAENFVQSCVEFSED